MFYMDNLRGELRDSIPVRPIYVMEEKKCHDIIYALLDVNYEKRSRKFSMKATKEMELLESLFFHS